MRKNPTRKQPEKCLNIVINPKKFQFQIACYLKDENWWRSKQKRVTILRLKSPILLTEPLLPAGVHNLDRGVIWPTRIYVSCQEVPDHNEGHLRSKDFIYENFFIPDIASLPVGLFNTPVKLSWRHACIYPLLADLFSIPTGLQALPTTLWRFI